MAIDDLFLAFKEISEMSAQLNFLQKWSAGKADLVSAEGYSPRVVLNVANYVDALSQIGTGAIVKSHLLFDSAAEHFETVRTVTTPEMISNGFESIRKIKNVLSDPTDQSAVRVQPAFQYLTSKPWLGFQYKTPFQSAEAFILGVTAEYLKHHRTDSAYELICGLAQD